MKESNLNSILSNLEAKSSALNTASETANQIISEIETKLISLNIGIEHWYTPPLGSSDCEGGAHETTACIEDLLGFSRVDGKWCLSVKRVKSVSGFFEGDLSCPYENKYLESAPSPLLNQSRNLRIRAIEVLPNFLENILTQVGNHFEKIKSATIELSR